MPALCCSRGPLGQGSALGGIDICERPARFAPKTSMTRKTDQMRQQTRMRFPPAVAVLQPWGQSATAVLRQPTARRTGAAFVRN